MLGEVQDADLTNDLLQRCQRELERGHGHQLSWSLIAEQKAYEHVPVLMGWALSLCSYLDPHRIQSGTLDGTNHAVCSPTVRCTSSIVTFLILKNSGHWYNIHWLLVQACPWLDMQGALGTLM